MKKIAVMVSLSLALMVTGLSHAAPKRPPTINKNRIGPYAVGSVGMTNYSSDQELTESILMNFLQLGYPSQNVEASTDETDIGYQANFGYRFHRFFAFELGLAKFGDLVTYARGDIDYPDRPGGFIPSTSELTFSASGVLMSALGVLPIKDKFEIFGRVGYMFASIERDFVSKAEGETVLYGGVREDTQEVVYGLGLGWNLNQVYAIHAEYQIVKDMGTGGAGSEDLEFLMLGLQVRF